MFAVDERTYHQRNAKHRAVRSQQKPALKLSHEKRAPLVDTNVARVLLKMFAPKFAPKSSLGQKVAWALAEASLPRTGRDTWTHHQALMELGALVCRAHTSVCKGCPCEWGVLLPQTPNPDHDSLPECLRRPQFRTFPALAKTLPNTVVFVSR